eukprot:gene10299-biopygen1046
MADALCNTRHAGQQFRIMSHGSSPVRSPTAVPESVCRGSRAKPQHLQYEVPDKLAKLLEDVEFFAVPQNAGLAAKQRRWESVGFVIAAGERWCAAHDGGVAALFPLPC